MVVTKKNLIEVRVLTSHACAVPSLYESDNIDDGGFLFVLSIEVAFSFL